MTSMTFFFVFIPLLAVILLTVNIVLAPHNSYQEKDSPFECGFHSFLAQNRTQFNISFFIFALLFLLFDLEILLVYPYVVSAYNNGVYGLMLMLIFFLALTLGFAFELGKGALKLTSRQNNINNIDIKLVNNISFVETNYNNKTTTGNYNKSNSVINMKSNISYYPYLYYIVNYLSFVSIKTNNIVSFINLDIIIILILLVCVIISIYTLIVLLMNNLSEQVPKTSIRNTLDEDTTGNPSGSSDEESQKQKIIRKIGLQKGANFAPRQRRNIYSVSYPPECILDQANIDWLHRNLIATHPDKYDLTYGLMDIARPNPSGLVIKRKDSSMTILPGLELIANIVLCPE